MLAFTLLVSILVSGIFCISVVIVCQALLTAVSAEEYLATEMEYLATKYSVPLHCMCICVPAHQFTLKTSETTV